jgi:hypothetical protein
VSNTEEISNDNSDKMLHKAENPASRPKSRVGEDASCLNDLAEIVAAWPRLPDAIKAGILAMVKACGDGE